MKKIAQITILTFCICMLFSANVFAVSNNTDEEEFNQDYPELDYDNLVTNFEKALNDDETLEDYTIGEEIIPLYSLENENFAFLTSIINPDNKIDGYVIIGATDGYYEMLSMEMGTNKAELYEAIYSYSNDYKIIYNFPFAFYYSKNEQLYEITNEDSSDNASEYKGKRVPDSDLEEFMNDDDKPFIDAAGYMERQASDYKKDNSIQIQAVTSSTYLDNWSDFVEVYSGSTTYYGGEQDWLHSVLPSSTQVSQFYANRSCGVCAAANVATYLSLYGDSSFENLYNRSSLSKSNFTKNMRDIYDYISPSVFGIPTIQELGSGFQEFADSRDVSLSPYYSDDDWTKSNVIKYIKKGLNSECPVLLLTWNCDISDLEYHWVTITKYYKTSAGVNYIVTSNHAEKCTYNFDTWYDGGSLYQGILYFTED